MEEYRKLGSWEDNIKMDLKELCIEVKNLMELAQDRDDWRALLNELVNIHISKSYVVLLWRQNGRIQEAFYMGEEY